MTKKIKSFSLLLLFALLVLPSKIYAYSDYIYVGGENIGIKINSKGVLVVGTYSVNGIDVAQKSGIKNGDMIIEINNNKVSSIDDMVSQISKANKESIQVSYIRENKKYNTDLNVIKDSNIYKTGLYVKDSITGIGTLTYIDPQSKIFGALGHEIKESNTGIILEIKDGTIYNSTVTSIDRSSSGNPGSKNATLDYSKEIGKISNNTEKGIFGKYNDIIQNKKLYKVANEKDIKTGNAKILTVLEGSEVKEYDINIIKINLKNGETKNIIFEITDKELLNSTGGVVQGMSGSPIIQDNKIIGAVTHVVVDNPIKGYGIFITNMLEEGEKKET